VPSTIDRSEDIARGTTGRGEAASPSKFDVAQYLATLILGAGVFLLPLEAAHVGMLPILLMLAGILWPCIKLYERVAALMVRRGDRLSGGGEALGRAVVEAGGGRAGTVLALLGIAVYVTGAAIVYNRLGVPGLEALATQANNHVAVAIGAMAVFVACAILVRLVPRRRVVARRLLRVTLVWGVGVALIATLGDGAVLTNSIGLALFAVGCLVVNRTAGPAETGEHRPDSLTVDHMSAVVGLRLQFVFMFVLAAAAVGLVVVSPNVALDWDALWVSDEFKLSDLLGPAAVVLFAHVGTGMSNVANYSAMASIEFRKSVVRTSLVLVTVVLAAWLVPTVLVFGHEGLGQMVDDKTNSALGLAGRMVSEGSAWVSFLAILGSLATLIAVTNANAGFITSLSREIIGAAAELGSDPRRIPSEDRLTLALVTVLTLAAGAAIAGGNTLAPMVHIAGITGGGVLVFTLPMLAEHGSRRARWSWGSGAVAVTVILGLWATGEALTQPDTSVAAVMIVVGWLPLAPTFFAARGVIRAAPADEARAEPLTTGPVTPEAATKPVPAIATSSAPDATRSPTRPEGDAGNPRGSAVGGAPRPRTSTRATRREST
jgi:amino acid permease